MVYDSYIGFEPSGKPHIGVIPVLKMIDQPVILFIANIHAKLNNKSIYAGFYSELEALAEKLKLDYKIIEADRSYLDLALQIELQLNAYLTTNRMQKALTITGKEFKGSEKFSILRYISLQVSDPFLFGVHHIYSGEDQRSCSVLSVEVGNKIDHPITFTTCPLMLNTKAKDVNSKKMSKSEPETCIFLDDNEIENKVNKATDFWVEHTCNLFNIEYIDYKIGRANLINELNKYKI
jgi:tryptophanyl-tRNA synthetase